MVKYDILYLNLPYTKIQYSTEYYSLDKVNKNNLEKLCDILSKMANEYTEKLDFSKDIDAHIKFNNLIRKTKAKYIIVKHNCDGVITKEYIKQILKRYCKDETYKCVELKHKTYSQDKTNNETYPCEYIFFIEKKMESDVVYNSPLNYIGGKGNLINIINKNIPKNLKTGIDLFGGGFNVGLNLPYDNIIYNDINFKVKELLEMFKENDTEKLCLDILKIIKKYNLKQNDINSYVKLREVYNKSNDKDPIILYVLILFGFQHQIRFNSKLEYNTSVGLSGYNDKIFEKIISFSEKIKEKKIKFYSRKFEDMEDLIDEDCFLYCDPPYLITLGSYNDGKRGFNGWNESDEIRLLNFLNKMDKKGVKFMLSNVLEHKEEKNNILLTWLKENNFNILTVNSRNRKEVIIMNYK